MVSTTTTRQQQSMVLYCWFKRDTIDNDASIVLRKDGQFVGFIVARIEGPETEPIGLTPPYRGTGLGRILLQHSMEELKKKGVESAFLGASMTNYPAMNLYEGFGFRKQYSTLLYAWEPSR